MLLWRGAQLIFVGYRLGFSVGAIKIVVGQVEGVGKLMKEDRLCRFPGDLALDIEDAIAVPIAIFSVVNERDRRSGLQTCARLVESFGWYSSRTSRAGNQRSIREGGGAGGAGNHD